ncbi:hypothetical protein [Sphingobacterium sp. 1.A.5]|uniref:hypothetical protein n=1 Tax=Sphingobacterium sp. 1.A.5 TaxID=2044604 RepID=UPI000C0C09D2|nr:hypothetical protein [Sphingobacterium sp. 1.A.5]
MKELTNKEKYLIVKNYILEGRIKENDFLISFLNKVAGQIAKGFRLSDKQITILDKYIDDIRHIEDGTESLRVQILNEEAKNTDVKNLLGFEPFCFSDIKDVAYYYTQFIRENRKLKSDDFLNIELTIYEKAFEKVIENKKVDKTKLMLEVKNYLQQIYLKLKKTA